jgi:threonine synthase
MKVIYGTSGYIAEPHGAVGYLGLKELLNYPNAIGIFLETAHPIILDVGTNFKRKATDSCTNRKCDR